MKTDQKLTTGNNKPPKKEEKNSSSVMKIFYAFMLLLLVSGSLLRFAGARRGNTTTSATPIPQNTPLSAGGAAARVLTFHIEDSNPASCEDLTIPATGSAVFTNCEKGVEKQFNLDASEQAQLQTWINEFKPIHYDHTGQTHNAGNETIQLFLNGQGSQQATALETQEILGFASSLAGRVASQQ